MPDQGTLLDGKYRLIYRIASGGMGEVWKARVELPQGKRRYCAVKFIRPDLPANPDRLEQFAREALTGYDVTAHPYLVTTRDFGESPLGPYVVTELIDGPNLTQAADELRDHHPMLRAITRASLLALYELHQSGKIHCDVSNNNILLSRTGAIKLADFGLARNRDSGPAGHVQGTIAFVSREEIELGQAFPQSDLYSLGVVLYQLVTGHSPFGSETIWQVERRMKEGPPDPLPEHLPADLTALIQGLMEFRLDKRLTIPRALDILHGSGEPIADPDAVAAFVKTWLATYMGEDADHTDQTESDPGASAADPAPRLETGATEPNPAPFPSRSDASQPEQDASELIEIELVTDRDAQDGPAENRAHRTPEPDELAAPDEPKAEQPQDDPDTPTVDPQRIARPRPRTIGLLIAAAVLGSIIGHGLLVSRDGPTPPRRIAIEPPAALHAPDMLDLASLARPPGLATLDRSPLSGTVASPPQPVPAASHATALADQAARSSVGPDPIRTLQPNADAISKKSTNAHRARGTTGTGRRSRRNDVQSYSWYQVPTNRGDLPATIGVELLSGADR